MMNEFQSQIWNQVLKAQVKARSHSEAQASMIEAETSINNSVDEIFSVIGNLSQSTAFTGTPPDLLVLPIPPGPLLLVNIRAAKGNKGSLQTLSDLNQIFNSRFMSRTNELQAQLLPNQRLFTYDIPSVWEDLVQNPSSHGLSVVDQPCYAHGTVCEHPNQYLFWDTLHPTTYIHQKLASMLKTLIQS